MTDRFDPSDSTVRADVNERARRLVVSRGARRAPRTFAMLGLLAPIATLATGSGCDDTTQQNLVVAEAGVPDAPAPPDAMFGSDPAQSASVTTKTVDTRFWTAEHMFAGFEMQQSGEPLSQDQGRQLAGYKRYLLPTDRYYDPSKTWSTGMIAPLDLVGFTEAIESYEYSKQPMNNLALESGAGTSLQFAPLVNPSGKTGADALALMRQTVQHLAAASHATSRWVSKTAPTATNPLGWPGLWPTLHPWKSFDPTIHPTSDVALRCAISSDDDPGDQGNVLSTDYECDYNTLHLVDRGKQIDRTITPGASGWAGWKYALWTINYLQIMHDLVQGPINSVNDSDLSSVGAPGNAVLGLPNSGNAMPMAGTFLGSSDIEGFQAGMFITILDNQAVDWLTALTTTDGKTLSGFSSLKDALAYDETSPLRWIPAEVAVTEADDPSGFPQPTGRSIAVADSRLFDLIGLAGSYASLYALADHNNASIGGSQPVHAYFDGDPFPDDDQKANGDPTPHDRALAMLRVILVNLVRLHRDPTTGVLADTVTMSGATPTRADVVDTHSIAYTIVGLRTVRRALSGDLALYTNVKPDAPPLDTVLDQNPWNGGDGKNIAQKLDALIRTHAEVLYNQLTDATGKAFASYSIKANAPAVMDDTLMAHAAAIRGLVAGYLATGDVKYRERALAVYLRMEKVFYDPAARIYATGPAPMDSISYGPKLYATMSAAFREIYEMIGQRPGYDALGNHLEDRIARFNKLVLNGWDDRNQDGLVDWPKECTSFDTIPHGGLQMAERTLSGETGSLDDRMNSPNPRVATIDREGDCVPEIPYAMLPSALAHEVTFTVVRK